MRRFVLPTAVTIALTITLVIAGCALFSPLTTEEQEVMAALPTQIEEQGGFIDELQEKLDQTVEVLQEELAIAEANLVAAATEEERAEIEAKVDELEEKLTNAQESINTKIDSAQTKYEALDTLLTKLRDKEATGADWIGASMPFIPDGPWKLPLLLLAGILTGKGQERIVGNKRLRGVVNSITQGTEMNGDGTGKIDMNLVGKFQDASGVRAYVRKARG